MSRTNAFQDGTWNPPTTDMRSPEYADYHREHFAPVRAQMRAHQVQAAREHIQTAAVKRRAGDLPGAARSLERAGVERSIAARMPNK